MNRRRRRSPITDASALVLLLTESANASGEVKKELSLASAQGITVYPGLFIWEMSDTANAL